MDISDVERAPAAELLQHACGDGRITLEEFSVRVGAVWAADDSEELAKAMQGVAALPAPVVGQSQQLARISNIMGENRRSGRWGVARFLHVRNIMGETRLDLRDAVLSSEALADGVVDIKGLCLMGEVKIVVPEGVEVELDGNVFMGARRMDLAPVARLAGTPKIRVNINVLMGEVSVRSAPPGGDRVELPRWVREITGR